MIIRCEWVQRKAFLSMPRMQMQGQAGRFWLQLQQRPAVYTRIWYLYQWVCKNFLQFTYQPVPNKSIKMERDRRLATGWAKRLELSMLQNFSSFTMNSISKQIAGKDGSAGSGWSIFWLTILGLAAAGLGGYLIYKYRLRVRIDLPSSLVQELKDWHCQQTIWDLLTSS